MFCFASLAKRIAGTVGTVGGAYYLGTPGEFELSETQRKLYDEINIPKIVKPIDNYQLGITFLGGNNVYNLFTKSKFEIENLAIGPLPLAIFRHDIFVGVSEYKDKDMYAKTYRNNTDDILTFDLISSTIEKTLYDLDPKLSIELSRRIVIGSISKPPKMLNSEKELVTTIGDYFNSINILHVVEHDALCHNNMRKWCFDNLEIPVVIGYTGKECEPHFIVRTRFEGFLMKYFGLYSSRLNNDVERHH